MPIAAHFDRTEIAEGTARVERRRVLLETRGALESGVETSLVLHNFSAEGVLLETAHELEIGESIDLELPGAPSTTARVSWASGRLYGCKFETPLSATTLSAVELRSAVQNEIGLAPAPAPPAPAAVGGETLGERLHRLRKLRGLTQGELAARLGVSKPTVWAWEQNRARPIDERLAGIAEALGVSSDDLKPSHAVPGLDEVLARCRDQVSQLMNVPREKVRIVIEL